MKDEFIVLKTGRNELTKVAVNEILYLKADGDYTKIKVKSGEIFIVSRNLKNTLKDFEFDIFVKINRSVVVNRKFVTRLKFGKIPMVKIDDSEEFRPSKTHINALKQIFIHTSTGPFHTMKGGVSHIYSNNSHIKQKPDKK